MQHNLNEDFLDSVETGDAISNEASTEMRYTMNIGEFPLVKRELLEGAPRLEMVYSIVKKYVDSRFEFAAEHETQVVFEWGEVDMPEFVQLKTQPDCSV